MRALALVALTSFLASCSGSGTPSTPPTGGGGGPGGGGGESERQTGIPQFATLGGPAPGASQLRHLRNAFRCVVVDLDDDGIEDLCFGPGIVVYGTRSGQYLENVAFANPGSAACAVADFDGDGDLDVVRGGRIPSGSHYNVVERNEGGRTYSQEGGGDWANIPDFLKDVLAMDVDGDGDADLVAAFGFLHNEPTGPQNVRLYLNDGDANFVDASHSLPFHGRAKTHVIAADLNGDQISDLVSVGEDGLYILIGDGAGGFVDRTSTMLPSSPTGVDHAAVGDLDGDQVVDLVIAHEGNTHVYLNVAGSFTRSASLGVDAIRVRLADADSDGDLDVALIRDSGSSSYQRGSLELFVNDGTAAFVNITSQVVGLGMADVDEVLAWQPIGGGQIADFVLSRSTEGTEVLRAVTLREYRSSASELPSESFAPFGVAAGDFDGDGDQDLITRVALGTDADCQIRWNDGAARFTLSPLFQMPLDSEHMATADFDGDGHVDLLTELGWYRGGALPFLLGAHWPGGLVATQAPQSMDVDGDGDLDIVLATASRLSWIESEAGVLTEHVLIERVVSDYELIDMNSDGVRDVVALPTAGLLTILLNDGSGGFTDVSGGIERAGFSINSFTVADMNLDGQLDFIVAGRDQDELTLFPILNAGNWVFNIAQSIKRWPAGINTRRVSDVFAADVDADGDMDILAEDQFESRGGRLETLMVFYHDGVDAYLQGEGARLRYMDHVVLVDLDGDRDLDIACSVSGLRPLMSPTLGSGLLKLNLFRHLESTGSVLTGFEYSVTIQEAAGYQASDKSAAILIGAASSGVHIEPLGTLFVTAPFASVPVTIPAVTGRGNLSIGVPAGGLPAGFRIHAQGVFFDANGLPGALSNPVVDVVVR